MGKIARSVVDVMLGEAVGQIQDPNITDQERLEDMLGIISVIDNRAKLTGTTHKDIISAKRGLNKQFDAYGKALPAGVEKYRSLAEKALNQVEETGPVHAGTYYATPEKFGKLSRDLKLEVVAQTAGHTYGFDPNYKPFVTARGVVAVKPAAIAALEKLVAPAPAAADPEPLGHFEASHPFSGVQASAGLPHSPPTPTARPTGFGAPPDHARFGGLGVAQPAGIETRFQSPTTSQEDVMAHLLSPTTEVAPPSNFTRGLSDYDVRRYAAREPRFSPKSLAATRAEMAANRAAAEEAQKGIFTKAAETVAGLFSTPASAKEQQVSDWAKSRYTPEVVAELRTDMAKVDRLSPEVMTASLPDSVGVTPTARRTAAAPAPSRLSPGPRGAWLAGLSEQDVFGTPTTDETLTAYGPDETVSVPDDIVQAPPLGPPKEVKTHKIFDINEVLKAREPAKPRGLTAYDIYGGVVGQALDNTGKNIVSRDPNGNTAVTNKWGVTTVTNAAGRQVASPQNGPLSAKPISGGLFDTFGKNVGKNLPSGREVLGTLIGSAVGSLLGPGGAVAGGALGRRAAMEHGPLGRLFAGRFPAPPEYGPNSSKASNRPEREMRNISPRAAEAIGRGKGGLY